MRGRRMRLMVVGAVLLVASCREKGIEGAWRSDEEMTVSWLRANPQVGPPKARAVAMAPGFFGQMYLVFFRGQAYSVYAGECEESTTYTETRLPGARRHEVRIPGREEYEISLEDGVVAVKSAFHPLGPEFFSRVSLDDVRAEFPCVDAQIRSDEGEDADTRTHDRAP